ncbi:protein of avirulence locus ImpE [Brucella gallinifaecis]|uniref:Protein of avirulence locus ImpE n=1 Tax=Brucella gallinifaecis TaxID=215590 RepID=A0A502BIH2_9HYPH|nr:protein of avirulence locus ImpE [Brucella gallinifaecis]
MLQGTSISAAITAVKDKIKACPADADLRAAFVQFLCLDGNWQYTHSQLKIWQALKPAAQSTTQKLIQSVSAEMQRQKVFAGEIAPRRLRQDQVWLQQMVQALHHDAHGDAALAQTLRDEALEAAAVSAGRLTIADNEQEKALRFEWLIDGDSRLGPVCELILNGIYYWLPFDDIVEIQFQAPQSAFDLVWSHAQVRLKDGDAQVCHLPARYPLHACSNDALLLGRRTEWKALGGTEHYMGLGLKTWFSDDNELPFHSLRHLNFDVDR